MYRGAILTILERVNADLKDAMRAKDRIRIDTLRSVISQISYRKIEAGNDLSPDEQLDVVRKLVKQRNDSITEFGKANRQDLVDKETSERDILQAYLPAQMDPEAVRVIVHEVLATLEGAARTEGNAMKALMPRLKDQVDGRVIRKVLLEELAVGNP